MEKLSARAKASAWVGGFQARSSTWQLSGLGFSLLIGRHVSSSSCGSIHGSHTKQQFGSPKIRDTREREKANRKPESLIPSPYKRQVISSTICRTHTTPDVGRRDFREHRPREVSGSSGSKLEAERLKSLPPLHSPHFSGPCREKLVFKNILYVTVYDFLSSILI